MSQTQSWTIGRLLTWTTDYLTKYGVENPRLDTEVLLAEARGCSRIDLYAAFEELANDEIRLAFRELVQRRAEGTPVAYLVGRREFYSLNFRVTPDVLIPRPETELLVVALLDRIRELPPDKSVTVADVGTGSGVIAVCAAKYGGNCQVTGIDISRPALDVAEANAADHGVAEQIEWIESDLFSALPSDRRFDLIVSNPPYVSAAEMETLAADIKNHEPRQALVAGEMGTEVIQRLVDVAQRRLHAGGWLLLEVGPTVVDSVSQCIESHDRFQSGPITKDLAGLPRVVQAQWKGG